MSDTFGEYSWAVRTYECGPDGAATMASVCNWLQEAASLNAEALAFSKSNFESAGDNISWVLTRLKVKMSRFPKWGETVSILTFPRGGRRIVAWRDFVLSDADGAELGRATSEWMLINLASRKVVAIPEAVFAAANTVREPVFGDEPWRVVPARRVRAESSKSCSSRRRSQERRYVLNPSRRNQMCSFTAYTLPTDATTSWQGLRDSHSSPLAQNNCR